MRRTVDRVEAAVRWVGLLAVSASIALAVVLGVHVDRQAAARADRLAATEVQVDAVVTAPSQDLLTGPGSRAGRAPVRWTAPDGSTHRDDVTTQVSARPGDVVTVWVLRDTGVLAPAPPATPPMALGVIAAGTAAVAAAGVVGLAWSCSSAHLSRRRDHDWQQGWATVEPLWRARGD
ncbi:hypothetical protein [Klenkia sp. PcliD-1-E]|uniref:Rv1733c family protein n=1 Tax=Klenkia sp. PcliD-1-E TaxID=2954492 RepID=UPI0020979ADB|nr:hypothetical protein [Klenkia sp. PcliD-1-E]MCO7218392.1 hypothetical protein [Klenkia sp. PcliD-1-E]